MEWNSKGENDKGKAHGFEKIMYQRKGRKNNTKVKCQKRTQNLPKVFKNEKMFRKAKNIRYLKRDK